MLKQLMHVAGLLISYGIFEGWGKLLTYAYESGLLHTLVYEQILMVLSVVMFKIRELSKTARHVIKHTSKFLSKLTVSKHRFTLFLFFLLLTGFEFLQDVLTDDLETIWKIALLIYVDQHDIPSKLLIVTLLLGEIRWLCWTVWLWLFANLKKKISKHKIHCCMTACLCTPVHVFCLRADIQDVPPP